MDVDPILDSHPPRYAVESDSEDEYGQSIHPRVPRRVEHADVRLLIDGTKHSDEALIVANGLAGTEWMRGIQFAEEQGSLRLGDCVIGSLYSTKQGVEILAVHHTLPPYACYEAALAVLSTLKPKSVAIIDSYVVPSYMSSAPISPYDSPVRVLRNTASAKLKQPRMPIEPYSSPNLVQFLSAAMLSLLESTPSPASLILLPALHIPSPPPIRPEPLPSNQSAWSETVVALAHESACTDLGIFDWNWKPCSMTSVRPRSNVRPSRGDVVGEGGMYI